MIKFSRLADYAVVILATLAQRDEGLMTASCISNNTSLPEPTVSKVLKKLAGGGLLISVRGASGGYKLAAAPENLSVAKIVVAVDGPVSLTACVEGSEVECDYECFCPVKGRWDGVNAAIRKSLEGISLSDMIARDIYAA